MRKKIKFLILFVFYYLLFSLNLFAQSITPTSEWVWENGDNTINSVGVYGTQGVPAAGNKPGARNGSVTWKDAAGNFWLYGGVLPISGQGYLNDLWKYSPSTNQWTWVNGDNTYNNIGVYGTQGVPASSNKPGARSYSCSWTDAAGNFWLLGGFGYSADPSACYLTDLWKYNPITNQWTWINGFNRCNVIGSVYGTKGVASATNRPCGRYGSSFWSDINGNFWLFGGVGQNGCTPLQPNCVLNDLWKYNPTTNQWTWENGNQGADNSGVYGTKGVPSNNNTPGSRSNSNFWVDATNNLWLFGGSGLEPSRGINGSMNDLWRYNPSTNQWTWVNGDNSMNNVSIYGTQGVSNINNKVGGRQGGTTWVDLSGNFWLFGGLGYAVTTTPGSLNDLWEYNVASNQWIWIKGDNSTNNIGIFGSLGVASATNKPGGRNFTNNAGWIDATGNLWLFGGGIGYASTATSGYLNDLWTLYPDGMTCSVGNSFCVSPLLDPPPGYQGGAAITVSYSAWGLSSFAANNQFTVLLSDQSGIFNPGLDITTLPKTNQSTIVGTVNAIIPQSTPLGSGYRVKVVSLSPAITSTDNGTDISITACPCTPGFCQGCCPLNFTVSPNPGNSVMNIKVSRTDSVNTFIKEVRLTDKMGNTILDNRYDNLRTINIDVSSLRLDIYTVRIFDGVNWEAQQFIKQ